MPEGLGSRWPRVGRPGRPRGEPMSTPEDRFPMCTLDRFLLWVDAVGGYWVCLTDEILLGQPVRSARVDVPLLGDLSGRLSVLGVGSFVWGTR